MKLVVLPGYSSGNRAWEAEIAKRFESFAWEVVTHQWGHWLGGSFSLEKEMAKILEEIGDDKVSIIAKSVGTRVAMYLIPKIINKLDKVIFVGIPTKFESTKVKTLYRDGMLKLGTQNLLCIQNTGDPFSPYITVKNFLQSVNPKIKIIEKPARNHEYPYYEEFTKFILLDNPR